MIAVSAASGKGGAGKTSLAAALADYLGAGCVVADCDVDAANGAIALGARVLSREDYYAGPGYRVVSSVCAACGACLPACRFEAIARDAKGAARIVGELCERCGACAQACPAGAVVEYEKRAGELFVSDTRTGPRLVHAELVPGEDTSGKLVAKVRAKARELAGPSGLVVVDSPPGIGCPVIASITGVDLVALVVEASASGLRDARRLAELARTMKRPIVAVINKAGLAPESDALARSFLAEAGIPLAGEIPFDPSLRSAEERGLTWASAGLGGEAGERVRAALRALEGSIQAIRHKKETMEEQI